MSYPGGKAGAGVYQTIINQIPPHDTYIEPFAGGGAVLRMKRPALASIVIDKFAPALRDLAAPGLTVLQGCGIEFLEQRQFTGREFVYADPPYLRSARRNPRDLYAFEMTDEDHYRLLAVLKRLPCSVAVSGYYSDLYFLELRHWRVITFTAMTRRGPAVEYLWMNYPEPALLHDYRYVGDDYREREKIARRIKRWRNRLSLMPAIERRALLSALVDSDRSSSSPACIDAGIDSAGDTTRCGGEITPSFSPVPAQQAAE